LTENSVGRHADAELDELKMRYLKALVRRIQQKKYYPSKARLKREEGEVLVAFLIERSGRIGNIHVTRSSGSPSLDAAAVKTLERVNPFQALPEELEMQSWELAVPIAYRLQH
jgi:protein TonB